MTARNDERRYGEREIDEIFALAADESNDLGTERGAEGGLTLAQLQEIGVEAGLPPERVADAAALVDASPAGLDLPRALTDGEWEQLVGELRTIYGAPGDVVSRGDAREWRTGELHVFVEPTAEGSRLRILDEHAPTAAIGIFGWIFLLAGAVLLATRGLDAATFGTVWELLLPLLMVVAGGGTLAGITWRERQRVARREAEMARIAARARELTGG